MAKFETAETISHRGLILVLSSPSGAGKSSISRALLERETNLVMSVSATTRKPRPTEIDGKDYFFVDSARFDEMVAAGEFLEHARVFDHWYGTPRSPVEAALKAGRDVLFDIDWQGTQQVEDKVRSDLVKVFVLPPSIEELERRLKSRAQDSAAVVARRMAMAGEEIKHWNEYDYVLVNYDLEASIGRCQAILAAERLKKHRQIGLSDFVNSLRG
jgi:guanylate kinase